MDSRTKILDAATELFLQGGGSALSVRAISKKAGLSTIGIYSHFNGKQGILDALYVEGFNLVRKAMDVVATNQASKEQVLQCCLAYLNVGEQNEAHYRLIFGESDSGYQPSAHAIAARDNAFSKLVSVAGSYLPTNSLPADRRQIALDVWAIVHGYVSISHHAALSHDASIDWKSMAIRVVSIHLDAVKDGLKN
jgi:AcrR family transcriptional regulator